jgi:hypothetical protein
LAFLELLLWIANGNFLSTKIFLLCYLKEISFIVISIFFKYVTILFQDNLPGRSLPLRFLWRRLHSRMVQRLTIVDSCWPLTQTLLNSRTFTGISCFIINAPEIVIEHLRITENNFISDHGFFYRRKNGQFFKTVFRAFLDELNNN